MLIILIDRAVVNDSLVTHYILLKTSRDVGFIYLEADYIMLR